MTTARELVLSWAEQGAIEPDRIDDALRVADVTPTPRDWRRFLEGLLLFGAVVLIAAGIIFFVAANWNELGRFGRFALVEAVVIGSVAVYWLLGGERPAANAALVLAALTIGALLALFGQTYQTGADPWQLFASWAFLIVPWVVVARIAALWLLAIVLINLAIVLYAQVFFGVIGVLFGNDFEVVSLVAFNTFALSVWELAAFRRQWLQQRWAIRVVAVLAGAAATALVLHQAFAARSSSALPVLLLYAAWIGCAYFVYRRVIFDLFVLAGLALSIIVTVTVGLSRLLLRHGDAGAFLLIGLAVVALSSGFAIWLKRVAQTERV